MSALGGHRASVVAEIGKAVAAVDEAQFSAAADLIESAERIFVIGVGREGLAARAFAMRLMHLGFEVHVGWDDTTPNVRAGDVLVMVNGSGRIGHLDYVFGKVAQSGAKTLVVTGVPSANTPQSATLALWVPAAVYLGEGDLVCSIQPMGSLFEQCALIVFDLMILELAERRGLSFADLAARHRNFE
ncbi:MAG: SIS domain-containing protein [Propionibacteriaceae bacterium]|jgi:6-phospho-3-hexuloisomerase|nr:SIS domain-containing protein [Propionibacteriaceae bacterium]